MTQGSRHSQNENEQTLNEVNKSSGNYDAACVWLHLMLDELLLH